jgi:hypothetical protein
VAASSAPRNRGVPGFGRPEHPFPVLRKAALKNVDVDRRIVKQLGGPENALSPGVLVAGFKRIRLDSELIRSYRDRAAKGVA